MVLSVGVLVQPLPTDASFEEHGAALVTVEGLRAAGAALLCTQHGPATPYCAARNMPLTAAPQSCSCKSHEPAPLGASEQRSYPPTGSQVAASHHKCLVLYKLK